MRFAAFIVACSVAVAGSFTLAQAKPEGIHAEKFPCVQCHTTKPGPNDTIEDAPLVLPIQELCAGCHETPNF